MLCVVYYKNGIIFAYQTTEEKYIFMDNIRLDICKVIQLDSNTFEVNIPYFVPTTVLTKVNDQKYFAIEVDKNVISSGFISGDSIEQSLQAIDQSNPYRWLRNQNPQIRDYRREFMGRMAPKKKVILLPEAEVEAIRERLIFERVTDFNKDFTVYYKSI